MGRSDYSKAWPDQDPSNHSDSEWACADPVYLYGIGGYFAARALQGVYRLFSMALQIGIIDALPEKDRSQGISYYSLFSYIPGIAGPVLALGLWNAGGMDYFSIFMIGIAMITGLFGYSIRMDKTKEPGIDATQDKTGQKSGMLASFGELIRNPFCSNAVSLCSSRRLCSVP